MNKIISLNIGTPKEITTNNQVFTSSVGRERVSKAYLFFNGFENDSVQYKTHGGPERAVLLYCFEHYQSWNDEFNKSLSIPAFGENLTVSGLSEENVRIGDIYKVGDATIQITQPRIPCSNLSNFNEEDSLLARLVTTGYTGFLARVLQEGMIYDDSTINLISRIDNSMTILEANEIYFHKRDDIECIKKLLQNSELASAWQEKLTKRLANLENND